MATIYHKHFIPLESNPELFTQLLHELGGSPSLSFQDIYSVDDPDLLSFLERPIHALVLTFPTTQLYDKDKRTEENSLKATLYDIQPHDLLWFKQTINNACGLYGLIHAVCNSKARNLVGRPFLDPEIILNDILKCIY
jgi:ubiquitin carboxyl-terminal hydrolase L3